MIFFSSCLSPCQHSLDGKFATTCVAAIFYLVGSDHCIRYNGRLAARPLLTQGVTTAVLFATGDLTAQQLVEKKGLKNHDVARTSRMALYGGCKFYFAA